MASGTRSQIGRIRRILNRRDPILPENGMSSFPSALSLLKIRGISPIKIRIFDYHRFSRPFSLSRPFSASLFHSLSHSLSFLSLSFYHSPLASPAFPFLFDSTNIYPPSAYEIPEIALHHTSIFLLPSSKKKHAYLTIKLIAVWRNYYATL